MAGPGYPMVASHDPAVIDAAPAMARETGRPQRISNTKCCTASATPSSDGWPNAGNQVRVYVPFGTQWYGYFMRRLAERPANLTFFMRALAAP